jgi:hypothetical protein
MQIAEDREQSDILLAFLLSCIPAFCAFVRSCIGALARSCIGACTFRPALFIGLIEEHS